MKAKKLSKVVMFHFVLVLCLAVAGSVFAAERTEIRVGTINSLTGVNAMTGKEHLWAYKLAIADINAKGGVYVKEYGKKLPIKLIVADDKSVEDQAAAAMERLIKRDKIDLALSTNITPLNLAAATVCEKYKMYYQIVVSFLEDIEKQNYKWTSDHFAYISKIARQPFEIWEALPEDQRPKRPALLMEDNMDGQGFGKGFMALAEEFGYKFAVTEPFAVGTKDFSSILLKYKAAKVDAIVTLCPPTDGITMLRQMKEQGLQIPFILGYKGFWPREFEQAMGKDANYVIHDGFWSDTLGHPGSKELQERFIKEFGYDSVSVGLSYSNPQVLAQAIERAGSLDAGKVRDEVFGGTFEGTTMGTVKYSERGIAEMPFLALQWWDGKRMPVYPAAPDIWKLKLRPKK